MRQRGRTRDRESRRGVSRINQRRIGMNISVVGTGYVGLVVGGCLAETGNQVIGADVDAVKIEGLQRNVLPIYEPGLDDIVSRNQRAGRLAFTDRRRGGRRVERRRVHRRWHSA